jgi:hypothetical protein
MTIIKHGHFSKNVLIEAPKKYAINTEAKLKLHT